MLKTATTVFLKRIFAFVSMAETVFPAMISRMISISSLLIARSWMTMPLLMAFCISQIFRRVQRNITCPHSRLNLYVFPRRDRGTLPETEPTRECEALPETRMKVPRNARCPHSQRHVGRTMFDWREGVHREKGESNLLSPPRPIHSD